MDTQVCRLNFPEYLLPLLRREKKILSLTFYQLPELFQLKSDPNIGRKEKQEILKNIFSEFRSRGLDVSYQEFVTMNMLDEFMVDEDEELTESQKYDMTNSWISKCLDSRIASLDQLITNAVHKTPQYTTPKQSLDGYCFDSTVEVRNREIWSQKYTPKMEEEKKEEEEEEEEDEIMSDVQINILKEKEDEEEELEEDKIQTIGNKRKREYKKTWFKTTIISNDPKIRRDISNSKENNYWNAIAKSINTKYVHTILWRKDITDVLRNYDGISMKIDGIIAVRIDKEKARLKFKNYVLHEGRYRDILLNDKSLLLYDDLINKENMTTNIVILDKKWKILKIISNAPNYELEWNQMEYAKRPQLEMDFTPVQWD
jgi:hypothetical protein